MTRVIVLT